MVCVLAATGLGKSFGCLPVLDNWTLRVGRGERVVLMGPSGCGKTTFLRIVAGLERPTTGTLRLPDRPRIGFVFQEPRLIPWRDVRGNLAFVDPAGDHQEILDQLRLGGFERTLPARLSGGMRQRVNLARALVSRPDLLILDEAFSSLDLATKTDILEDLQRLGTTRTFTIVAVTHDPKEAVLLADRIVLVSGSPSTIVTELAVPSDLVRHPTSMDCLRLEAELTQLIIEMGRGGPGTALPVAHPAPGRGRGQDENRTAS